MKKILFVLLVLIFPLEILYSIENEECLSCHGQKIEGIPNARERQFKESIHGGNSCVSCHSDIQSIPHPSKLAPVSCGTCHAEIEAVYDSSVHGKAHSAGVKEAPVCVDCHGEHTIRSPLDPSSTVWKGAITKTCSHCHDSEKIISKFGLPADRLQTFRDSYHGLASRGGDLRVANCASCHGWHNVLSSDDPESSIHPGNIAKTCGKCHMGARVELSQRKIHGADNEESFFVVRWVRYFYLIVIPLILGGMALIVFSDYLKKIISQSYLVRGASNVNLLRMNIVERVQHAFLLVAFFTLAYSGFSLKYPEAWWVAPFHWAGGEWFRKGLHRWTALVFALIFLVHIFYMVFSRRGRFILRHRLFPKIRDCSSLFKHLLGNLGVIEPKKLLYPSYIERMEYWALLWGSLIMMATGALLVFNNATLRYLPLWVTRLATMVHFYEAILACASIFIWHFYWTIFDPDIYPMNWAWLLGRARRKGANNGS